MPMQPQASHDCPAPFVIGVTTAFRGKARGAPAEHAAHASALGVEVIGRIDLMQGTRDCRGTPSLIDAQIGDDVRNAPSAVAYACVYVPGGAKTATAIDAAYVRDGTEPWNEKWDSANINKSGKPINVDALPDDLRRTPTFGGPRGREPVAQLRRIGDHFPAAVAGVGVWREAQVSNRRLREEVEERLRTAEGEAGPLDEGAVGVECLRRIKDRVALNTNGEIAAHRPVFGLVAGIGRDVAADTIPEVVRPAVVNVATLDAGRCAVHTVGRFKPHIAADLDAHISARDVIETHPVQAANLHVLDRRGLYGKIGCLRPSYRNESRCRD